jgi:hypothetical protein
MDRPQSNKTLSICSFFLYIYIIVIFLATKLLIVGDGKKIIVDSKLQKKTLQLNGRHFFSFFLFFPCKWRQQHMKCFQSSLNFTEHVLLGKHLTWKCPKKREFYENCLLIPLLEPNTSQHASIELAGQTKHVSISKCPKLSFKM